MSEATPLPRARSIIVRLHLDEDGNLLATNANGAPRVLNAERCFRQLTDMVTDPTVPEATVESTGFSIGDVFKGGAKFLADLHKSENTGP